MKIKLLTAIFTLAFFFATTHRGLAYDKATDVVADVVLVRPGCFIATVVGSAFFVVALPFAVLSKTVKKTAHTLIVAPGRATFTRPLGDFTDLSE